MASKKHLSHIKEKFHELTFLGKCNPKIRRFILQNSDKKLIKAIRECLHNFLKGNIKVTPDEMKKLKKYKNSIRLLAGENCFKKNKQILVQSGGFLPFIIPVAIEVISSIIKNLKS